LFQEEVRKWAKWLNEKGYEIMHAKPRFSKRVRQEQGKIPPSRRKPQEQEALQEGPAEVPEEGRDGREALEDLEEDGESEDGGEEDEVEEDRGKMGEGVMVIDASPSPQKLLSAAAAPSAAADAGGVDGSPSSFACNLVAFVMFPYIWHLYCMANVVQDAWCRLLWRECPCGYAHAVDGGCAETR
jgi:hypothetical protein